MGERAKKVGATSNQLVDIRVFSSASSRDSVGEAGV